MPKRSAPRLCLHCHAILSDDERDHYVYACHPCVEAEHDAHVLSRNDPVGADHGWIARSPILIEIGPRGRSSRAA